MTVTGTNRTLGPLLKDWRARRAVSQMELALDVGVSTRHLSFVETGRSRPSPELLLALAERLEVPLRERNDLLLAAGYAPQYRHTSLEDESMLHVRRALERILTAHQPFPGIVIDRYWNVVMANEAASSLIAGVPPHLTGPPLNVFRISLHPDGLAAATINLEDLARYLLERLRRLAARAGADPAVADLVREVQAYPTVAGLAPARPGADPSVLIPWELTAGGERLSLWTTLTTFGTPQDITLDDLAVELFYPSDEATRELLEKKGPTVRTRRSNYRQTPV